MEQFFQKYADVVNIGMFIEAILVFVCIFLISLKLYIGKNFNNILFWILLIIFSILPIVSMCVMYLMTMAVNTSDGVFVPIIHHINNFYGPYFTNVIPFLFIPVGIMTIVFSIFTLFRKQKACLKPICTILFLLFVLLISFPGRIASIHSKDYADLDKMKLATDFAILPAIKGEYANQLSYLYFLKYSANPKYPFIDYKDPETLKYIENELKYTRIYTRTLAYSNYIMLLLKSFIAQQYDKFFEYLEEAEKYGVKSNGLLFDVYIQKEKLDEAEKLIKDSRFPEYNYARLLIAKKQYSLAYKYVKENESKIKPIKDVLFYLHYSMGNMKEAKSIFSVIKWRDKVTMKEYYEYLSKTQF